MNLKFEFGASILELKFMSVCLRKASSGLELEGWSRRPCDYKVLGSAVVFFWCRLAELALWAADLAIASFWAQLL